MVRLGVMEIDRLFARVRSHPRFVVGTIFIHEDIAAALFDVPVEDVTEEQLAAVGEKEVACARDAIRALIFEGPYSWREAIRDAVSGHDPERAGP